MQYNIDWVVMQGIKEGYPITKSYWTDGGPTYSFISYLIYKNKFDLVKIALEYGNYNSYIIHNHKTVYPYINQIIEAIEVATEYNDLDIKKYLKEYLYKNFPINFIKKYGKITESLSDYVKPKSEEEIEKLTKNLSPEDILYAGAQNGIISLVQKALKQLYQYIPSYQYNMKNKAFNYAVEEGHIDIVKLLLQDEDVDPSFDNNIALLYTCTFGYEDMFKLLLSYPEGDPSETDNICIRTASEYGYYNIVKLLMQDPRVDPSARDNEALQVAKIQNHINIVKLLLTNKKVIDKLKNSKHFRLFKTYINGEETNESLSDYVKPKSEKELQKIVKKNPNEVLAQACKNGELEIVKLALKFGADPNYIQPDDYDISDFPAWLIAAEHEKWKVVKLLLQDPRVNPSEHKSLIFSYAVIDNQKDIVKKLLKDPRINPNEGDTLMVSFKLGNYEISKILLKDPRIDPSDNNNQIIPFLIKRMNTLILQNSSKSLLKEDKEMIDLLLKDKRIYSKLDTELKKKYYSMLKKIAGYFVKESLSDYTKPKSDEELEKIIKQNPNDALFDACKDGDIKLVKQCLAWGAQPNYSENSCLLIAGSNGHYDIVRLLLEYPEVDPGEGSSEILAYAILDNEYELVKKLLEDSRVQPTFDNSFQYVIQIAKDTKIVELFLKDPRIDPSENNNYAIKFTYRQIDENDWSNWKRTMLYRKILKLLLMDERIKSKLTSERIRKYEYEISKLDELDESLSDYVKPKSKEEIKKTLENLSSQEKLEEGCENDILWLVQEALDEGANPSDNDNYAIRVSSYFGYNDIVKLLLADPRVDPSGWNNTAIRWASENGHSNVVKLLLNDKRVYNSLIQNLRLKYEKEIRNLKESLRDYVKPKSEEEIIKIISTLTPNEKLREAIKYHLIDIIKEAIDEGANLDRSQIKIGSLYVYYRPLIDAIGVNDLNIVKLLLKYYNYSKSDLHQAIYFAEQQGKKIIKDYLLNYNTEIKESLSDYAKPKSQEELKIITKDLSNEEKMIMGCKYNMPWMVQEAIDNGIQKTISIYDKILDTYIIYQPLMLISTKGHVEVAKILLNNFDYSLSEIENGVNLVKLWRPHNANQLIILFKEYAKEKN